MERTANYKQALELIIRPLPDPVYQCHVPINYLKDYIRRMEDECGKVNMTPDFQRGHVWSRSQQERFIEGMLRKTVTANLLTIQFNYPHWNQEVSTDLPREVQCIDGLQRFTAITLFMDGEIKAFGHDKTAFDGTRFTFNRISSCIKMQMHSFPTKRELLRYYLDLNEGGTPHTESDLARVREMLSKA